MIIKKFLFLLEYSFCFNKNRFNYFVKKIEILLFFIFLINIAIIPCLHPADPVFQDTSKRYLFVAPKIDEKYKDQLSPSFLLRFTKEELLDKKFNNFFSIVPSDKKIIDTMLDVYEKLKQGLTEQGIELAVKIGKKIDYIFYIEVIASTYPGRVYIAAEYFDIKDGKRLETIPMSRNCIKLLKNDEKIQEEISMCVEKFHKELKSPLLLDLEPGPESGRKLIPKPKLIPSVKNIPSVSPAITKNHVVFLIDCSFSMRKNDPNAESRLEVLNLLLRRINIKKNNISIIFFSSRCTVIHSTAYKETTDFMNAIKKKIFSNGQTCIQCAFENANNILSTSSSANKSIIFLSDGAPSFGTVRYDDLIKIVSPLTGKIKFYSLGLYDGPLSSRHTFFKRLTDKFTGNYRHVLLTEDNKQNTETIIRFSNDFISAISIRAETDLVLIDRKTSDNYKEVKFSLGADIPEQFTLRFNKKIIYDLNRVSIFYFDKNHDIVKLNANQEYVIKITDYWEVDIINNKKIRGPWLLKLWY